MIDKAKKGLEGSNATLAIIAINIISTFIFGFIVALLLYREPSKPGIAG